MIEMLPIVAMCPTCFKNFDIAALRCPRCAKPNVYHPDHEPAPKIQTKRGSCGMCGKAISEKYQFCYHCLQIKLKTH